MFNIFLQYLPKFPYIILIVIYLNVCIFMYI